MVDRPLILNFKSDKFYLVHGMTLRSSTLQSFGLEFQAKYLILTTFRFETKQSNLNINSIDLLFVPM